MKRILAAIAVSLMFVSFSFGDTLPTIDKAKSVAESAIGRFTDGDFQEGLDLLKPYWPASPVTIDNMAVETRKQWSAVKENYGDKIGMELVKTSAVGQSLVRFTHLVRFERYALVFETILYKGSNGWFVIDFKFNDTIKELF